MLDFKENIEQIYGLDMNYEALKIAYDNASRLNPSIPVNFMATNLLSVPLGDSKFNFLMSFHTLEHIYPVDAPKFVSEIFRMLAPGAKFLISIPYERAYPDPAHVAFYNVESVCALFEDAGFETIECLKDNRWSEKNLLTGLFEKPLK
jgi:ubiquinone/menaquinone biosynthesis C-methylase UbiE